MKHEPYKERYKAEVISKKNGWSQMYLTTPKVSIQTNISERVLEYWVNKNVIQPAHPGTGSGYAHGWSSENLFILKILSLLREQIDDTIVLTNIRKAIQARIPTDEVVMIQGGIAMCSSWADIPFESFRQVTMIVALDQP